VSRCKRCSSVVAHARDGYEAVFSTGELDEGVGGTRVLIVWASDGKRLDEKDGPLRLAVLSDHSPARSLFQLDRLDVQPISMH
jgi:hypothetical protein